MNSDLRKLHASLDDLNRSHESTQLVSFMNQILDMFHRNPERMARHLPEIQDFAIFRFGPGSEEPVGDKGKWQGSGGSSGGGSGTSTGSSGGGSGTTITTFDCPNCGHTMAIKG